MKKEDVIKIIEKVAEERKQYDIQYVFDDIKNYVLNQKKYDYDKILNHISQQRSGKLAGIYAYKTKSLEYLKEKIKEDRKNGKNANIRYSDFHKPIFEFLNKNDIEEFSYFEYEVDDQQYNGKYVKYSNKNCVITIHEKRFDVTFKTETGEQGTMYSKDLNIYWLVGVLTWYNLIDKNYKQ